MSVEDLPWWNRGISGLSDLYERHGPEARQRAVEHAERYAGRRAEMVFDVVASRQRRYTQRVVPMVEKFAVTPAATDLRSLAEAGPGEGHGLREGEGQTMQAVAAGLLRYLALHDVDEDAGLRLWATEAAPFEHAPKLEPFVGSVKGMGPALLAYLRMRCGADAIKPDLRVRASLNRLGFEVPRDEHSILVVARHASHTLGLPLLVLDQLLWWADPN